MRNQKAWTSSEVCQGHVGSRHEGRALSRPSADSYWDNKGINEPAEEAWHCHSPCRRGEAAMSIGVMCNDRSQVEAVKRECLGGGQGGPVWRWKGEPELCRGQRWGHGFQAEIEQSSTALHKKHVWLKRGHEALRSFCILKLHGSYTMPR